ncbi:hypothetical protein EBQ81_00860 [bacterium]|nr:hypothetical protein [bacterium]
MKIDENYVANLSAIGVARDMLIILGRRDLIGREGYVLDLIASAMDLICPEDADVAYDAKDLTFSFETWAITISENATPDVDMLGQSPLLGSDQ